MKPLPTYLFHKPWSYHKYFSVAVFISVALVFATAAINGIESVQTFALPMAIGVVSGRYTSVCLTAPFGLLLKKQGTDTSMTWSMM